LTVQDAIQTTLLADSEYFHGEDSTGRVAIFSPDGKQFVLVLRKANVANDVNEYTLLRYYTVNVWRIPKPDLLVTMRSRDREAIHHVRWLSDSRTLIFIGA